MRILPGRKMKILAIVGTARKNGIISTLCQNILSGAKKNGHDTEILNLYDYNINYCIGCWACAKKGKCFQDDDFEIIFNKMKKADVIIIGSPVYWANVSAVMKNFFDRSTGYAMYIPEKADVFHKLSTLRKIKTLINQYRNFGPKKEIGKKHFIIIIASTIFFPITKIYNDVDLTVKAMTSFVKKLNGKLEARLVYTDTLFKFKKKKEEKMMEKAYRIGRNIR